jgi:Rrf2 family protein
MGLRLTRAADYGIRAMLHIGSLPEGGVARKDEIAEAQQIPPSFMAKILRQLVKSGVLRSSRGTSGGFGLARAAAEINVLDIVEGIEGPIQLTDCSPDPEQCALSHDCPASTVWLEVQRRMSALLRETTLEDMLAARRKDRRVVYNIGPSGRRPAS